MLQACGITAFLTPLPSIARSSATCVDGTRLSAAATDCATTSVQCATGDIKGVPEDFVVVEVDPARQRTDAENYKFSSAIVSDDPQPAQDHLMGDEAEEGLLAGHDGALSPLPVMLPRHDRMLGTCSRSAQALQDILSTHTRELERFFGTATEVAARASSTFTQATLSVLLRDIRGAAQGNLLVHSEAESSPLWWRRAAHTLGRFPNKQERQLLHLIVRRRFPHLGTCADAPVSPSVASGTSSGSDDASVVSCFLNLHYVLFCATLGNEAALCIARWSVEAQAARHERKWSDEMCAELHQLFDCEDKEVWAASRAHKSASAKGLCNTSFDSLTEAMRRQPFDKWAVCVEAESMPLVSDKDVRRQVHELLRRFYPFVNCQVREGHVTLRMRSHSDRSGHKPTCDGTAHPTNTSGTGVGARRTRAAMEADSADASTASATPVSKRATPAYVHIIVKKRNLETAEMRQLLGEYFGVRDGAVCIAGMKDKKAVSVQRCSVPVAATEEAQNRVHALLGDATAACPVTLRWPADPQQSYAVLLRAAPFNAPIQLGQLSGNWFSLRLRGVRWASEEDRKMWGSSLKTTAVNGTASAVTCEGAPQPLRDFIQCRFERCVEIGFINYFGQQRFSEAIERVSDHTGVHLFAARWVAAVRSLYRACPDVYNAFPEKMEARFVPSNLRDAQVMTHALRQTYRMYFSQHPLHHADVQMESEVWTCLCEKAITEGVPFYLRSLWVHAGQSAFFNCAASYAVSKWMAEVSSAAVVPHQDANGEHQVAEAAAHTKTEDPTWEKSPASLALEVLASAELPLGGYQGNRMAPNTPHSSDPALTTLWTQVKDAAIQHALRELHWTSEQGFGQRRVAGVPVPGSWRAVVARPTHASFQWEAPASSTIQQKLPSDDGGDGSSDAMNHSTLHLSFFLPLSCYATVFLREVLGCDKWW
ncbi:hypothetical protein JKF63_02708 [Porcisia hertigi]|uniref:TRUD domain-containing protein n=1 Tax=Porcisia hertigi TaxID=2761500 RepID=A0A836IFF1_9TRYP|nr:hypothetical protein JKF63_02708 [Porcisia hertigi]